MDRGRLERFLTSNHRTFRWNDGETREEYEAVETTDEGLRWYRWSHRAEDGGPSEDTLQSYDDFAREGPQRPMPDHLRLALEAHVAARRPGARS